MEPVEGGRGHGWSLRRVGGALVVWCHASCDMVIH